MKPRLKEINQIAMKKKHQSSRHCDCGQIRYKLMIAFFAYLIYRYCGIAFLIVGFIGLIASLIFCVYLWYDPCDNYFLSKMTKTN